jgi:hypothetical protein
MFFKRKPKETKPLCFHEWRVADFGTMPACHAMELDDIYYVIGCEKCGSSRTLDEWAFSKMKNAGFIKEASE